MYIELQTDQQSLNIINNEVPLFQKSSLGSARIWYFSIVSFIFKSSTVSYCTIKVHFLWIVILIMIYIYIAVNEKCSDVPA